MLEGQWQMEQACHQTSFAQRLQAVLGKSAARQEARSGEEEIWLTAIKHHLGDVIPTVSMSQRLNR